MIPPLEREFEEMAPGIGYHRGTVAKEATMRTTAKWAGVLALALIMAAPATARQAKKPCPMSSREQGLYCERCSVVLKKEEIKDGKCAKHDTEALKAEVCVRRHFICATNACSENKAISGKCKCAKPMPLKEDVNRTIISHTCQGCGGQSTAKDKVTHSKDCKKKDLKAACGHGF